MVLHVRIDDSRSLVLPFRGLLYRFLSGGVYRFQECFPFHGALCRVMSLCPFFFVRALFYLCRIRVNVLANAPGNVFGGNLFHLFPIWYVVGNFFRKSNALNYLYPIFRVFGKAIRTISKRGTNVYRLPFLFRRAPNLFKGPGRFLCTNFPYPPYSVNSVDRLIHVITGPHSFSGGFYIVLAKLYLRLYAWSRKAWGFLPT